MLQISGFDHFVLTVRDMAATISFYTHALGMAHAPFTVADGSERHALSFGPHKINLHQAGREFTPHADNPARGSGDFCLITEASLEDWAEHLASLNITIEEGPVKRTGARGPITSLYIRDPDGCLVEVARYDS